MVERFGDDPSEEPDDDEPHRLDRPSRPDRSQDAWRWVGEFGDADPAQADTALDPDPEPEIIDHDDPELNDPDGPAPFDAAIAERLPERLKRDDPTQGLLVGADGTPVWDQPLQSGYDGPVIEIGGWRAIELPKPYWTSTHVEAHASAEMRRSGITDATLYLNNPPDTAKWGCDRMLPRMLPPEAKLTVYGPDGFCKIYRGLPTEER